FLAFSRRGQRRDDLLLRHLGQLYRPVLLHRLERALQAGRLGGDQQDRDHLFGPPNMPPRLPRFPSADNGLSAAAASWAARSAELTAASTRSSSMATSRGSTACLSICTLRISPLPLAVTITIPPPAEPVTSFFASRSCASFIFSCSACACWKRAFRSKLMVSLLAQIADIFDLAAEKFHRALHGGVLAADGEAARLRLGPLLLVLLGDGSVGGFLLADLQGS